MNNLIEHVNKSIKLSLEGRSGSLNEAMNIRGFATRTQRHLINNLCLDPVSTYLEIGLFCGATICAAMSGNKHLRVIGIDDCSEFAETEDIRTVRDRNLNSFERECGELLFFHDDCYKLPESIKERILNVDFYYYDASHEEELTTKALPEFIDQMANQFIFMVDDTNWPFVTAGVKKGFEALKDRIRIEESWNLTGELTENDPIWHNGVQMFVLSKL